MPVESYLSIQGRYAHLFGEGGRPDIVARIQAIADHNILRYGLLEKPRSDSAPMETSP
jgi:pyruvate ferredoxin oxidoreductase beta subunit